MFWPSDVHFVATAPSGGPEDIMCIYFINYYHVSGVPALLTFMNGQESEDMTDEEIKEVGMCISTDKHRFTV